MTTKILLCFDGGIKAQVFTFVKRAENAHCLTSINGTGRKN